MADLALEVNPDTSQPAILVKESKNSEHVKLTKVKPVYLAWKGVNFAVGEKRILNNLNGAVDPGEVCPPTTERDLAPFNPLEVDG